MADKKSEELLDPLDPRRRKYVAGRLEGKGRVQAALDAGFTPSMAEKAATKIENKDVRRAFMELARQAVPTEKLMQRLAEGLDATKVRAIVRGKKVVDKFEVPDYRERREYAWLVAKFSGQYVERSEVDLNAEVDIAEPGERIRELLERADSRSAELSK
jgi:hypothetical protein